MSPHYSRRGEEALARGETVDPESYDVGGDPLRAAGSASWAIQRDSYPIAGKELVDTTTRIAIAYILDRAEQYIDGSGVRAAFDELIGQLKDDEHLKAFRHGELDDLLKEDDS